MKHPATRPLEDFSNECRFEFTRRQGPGGQHRNKVETAVIATHVPTQVQAESNGERSQGANRTIALFRLRVKLAIEIRSVVGHDSKSETESESKFVPSELWIARLRGSKISINPRHDDFPAMLAEALDRIDVHDGDISKAAEELRTTSSQLAKLLKNERPAWNLVNQWRKSNDLRPLK